MSPEDDFVLGVFILFLRFKGRLSGRASSVSLKAGPVCRWVDGSSFCQITCPVGLLYCLSLLPRSPRWPHVLRGTSFLEVFTNKYSRRSAGDA